jgi:hypothetical protein
MRWLTTALLLMLVLAGDAQAKIYRADGVYLNDTQALTNKTYATVRTTPAYGASVAINAALGNLFAVTATNATAFTIANPTNPTTGQRLTIMVRNTSGGALGAVTWDTLYKLAAWTSPATTLSRSIDFVYDGTNWVEVGRTTVDVPN